MKQFFKVFKFEFLNILRSKAFIFLTLLLFVGSTVMLFSPRFKNDVTMPEISDGSPKSIAIFDSTNTLGEFLKANLQDLEVTICQSESEATALLKEKKVDASIKISSPLNYTYSVNDMGMYDVTTDLINQLLEYKYKEAKLKELGLTQGEVTEIMDSHATPEFVVVGQDQSQSFLYTYILLFMIYIAVIAYGQMIAQSVATEKSSRAMELLITSAKPESLIFGKVLGTAFAGLSQMVAILLWAVICYKINASYWEDNFLVSSIFDMPISLIVYASIFFVLGFLIYAFLYGALGSLASKMEDIGTLTMPLTVVMVIAFMIPLTSVTSGNVDSSLMKILSFIPFCTPMAMFARIAMSTVPNIQIAISIILLFVSNIIIGYVAVIIYRMGILMYGKVPKLSQIIKGLKKR